MDVSTKKALAARARTLRVELCRRDPNAFIQHILRDEENGKRVTQSPYHALWQNLVGEHKRLILWSHVESGKTQQISVGRILWELGCDPTLRIAMVSNTGTQASKMLRSIAQYITDSDDVKEVFPHLRPGGMWTNEAITVERDSMAKDASVQALGMHGNILGARLDFLIMDDILDYENTRTDYQRTEALRWIESTLFGRLTKRARIVFIGNAWHREDAMHILSARKGWHAVKCPVVTEDGKPVWEARWDLERLEDKKQELGPLEFARQMLCEARADGASRFRTADVQHCLERGAGLSLLPNSDGLNGRVFTGVDLGVSKRRGSGLTVFFTVLVCPNGDRRVLNIDSGRWTANEILGKLEHHHKAYGGMILVESNAAQKFIVQLAHDKNIPVKPFFTGKNKTDPRFGVESLSAELARGQWIIPCNEDSKPVEEVKQWIDELLYYDPDTHTGDRLMASWIAKEGIRRGYGVHRFGTAGSDNTIVQDSVVDQRKNNSVNVQGEALWQDLESFVDLY